MKLGTLHASNVVVGTMDPQTVSDAEPQAIPRPSREVICRQQGNFHQAIPALERAFALMQGAHIRILVPRVASTLGAVYALAGRTAEALPLLEQAIVQASAVGFMIEHALRVVWLGEAYLRAGRLEEAYTQTQRTLDCSHAHQERGYEAYALWLHGVVRCRVGNVPPYSSRKKRCLTVSLSGSSGPLV